MAKRECHTNRFTEQHKMALHIAVYKCNFYKRNSRYNTTYIARNPNYFSFLCN